MAMVSSKTNKAGPFEKLAIVLTQFTGGTGAFILAFCIVIVWGLTRLFNLSENWQLAINNGTAIITFLMVFLIQRTQNKGSLAIQLKLNELIASAKGASNKLIDVENLSEKDLNNLKGQYNQLTKLFEKEIK